MITLEQSSSYTDSAISSRLAAPIRVCLLVGDRRTIHCGVKDYAQRLAAALMDIGIVADVFAPDGWTLLSWLRLCTNAAIRAFDIIHIQYPSIGHRASLGPHLLGAVPGLPPVIVTLHEYSAMPLLQRRSTHLFRLTSNTVIFTADAERHAFGRSATPIEVIPIGSNVPEFVGTTARERTIVYFGQIRPAKGLEQFLDLANYSITLKRPFTFRVIGSVPDRRRLYYETIRGRAARQVKWDIGASMEDVGRLLATSLAAYLPFPDGATFRRGSLLASLTNGLPVITTIGPHTPRELMDVVMSAGHIQVALEHIERLNNSPVELDVRSRAARSFASKFQWRTIATEHQRIYKSLFVRKLAGSSRLCSIHQNSRAPAERF